LGFALTDSGYSWALLVRFREGYATDAGREICRNLLTLALWQAWAGCTPREDEVFERVQTREAEATIRRIRPTILDMLDQG
jgi:hypothetical protein